MTLYYIDFKPPVYTGNVAKWVGGWNGMEFGAWTLGLFACWWNNPCYPRLLPGLGAVHQPLNTRTLRPLMAFSRGTLPPLMAAVQCQHLGAMQELIPD